jgi:hypothetical protein
VATISEPSHLLGTLLQLGQYIAFISVRPKAESLSCSYIKECIQLIVQVSLLAMVPLIYIWKKHMKIKA